VEDGRGRGKSGRGRGRIGRGYGCGRVGRECGDGRGAGRGEQPLLTPLVPLPDPPDLIMEEIVTVAGSGCGPHGGRVEDGVPPAAGRGRGPGEDRAWTWMWEDREMVRQWSGWKKRGATDDNPARPTSRPPDLIMEEVSDDSMEEGRGRGGGREKTEWEDRTWTWEDRTWTR